MSTTINSRVVEMRFDNKEFEANAKTTLDTLNNLKKALNENIDGSAFESLDRAARNVDLSSIERSLDALTDRFSTFGIVGMRVIENITDGLMSGVKKGIDYVTEAIQGGGLKRALNIQGAQFQLEGIVGDLEEVTKIMNDAKDSVTDTAFAYDEAAKAASMFAATGMRSGEEMQNALAGISGVAATTSSDYEGIARIFTTVAGNGRLMGDQLLQLSTRGLNAAATLKDFFQGVSDGSIQASENVTKAIQSLLGAEGLTEEQIEARTEALEKEYEAAAKQFQAEYDLRKKTLDKEYKALQKTLNNEYNLKKSEYDKQYKALQELLSNEVSELQKANSKRLEEANEAYQAEVEAYREATNERISLINEEYTESIKLIDEERYNKIKAIEDQINAINEQSKAEQKARELAEEEQTRSEIQSLLAKAKNNKTRKQAEQALAEFEAQVAQKRLKEERQETIDSLNEEKSRINEEASLKKQEAAEKRQAAVESVQDESNARLKEMQKAHQEEIEALREQQQLAVDAMREQNSERLAALKESQNIELESLKEAQTEQLEIYRENQNEQLSALKETNNEKLKETKNSIKEQTDELKEATDFTEITEAAIRDMVSKGLISFDIFSEAMGKTFGQHAKDADKTFNGAMANIRAALARTGAMFYQPLIQDSGPLVKLFNTIKGKINDLNGQLEPLINYLTSWLNQILIPNVTEFVSGINTDLNSNWQVLLSIGNILESIVNVGKFLGSIVGTIAKGFTELFSIDSSSIYDATNALAEFTSNLKLSNKLTENLNKILKALNKLFKSFWQIIKQVVGVFKPLSGLFKDTTESSNSLIDSFAKLIERFADWLATSKGIQAFFSLLTSGMELFVKAIIATKDKIAEFKEGLSSFDVGSNFVIGFIEGVKSVSEKVFTAVKEFFTNVLDKIKEILGIHSPSTVTFEYGVFLIQGLLEGIKSVAEIAINTVRNLFTRVIETIKEVFSGFNSNEVDMDGEGLGSNFIMDFIRGVKDNIPNPIKSMKEFFSNMKNKILDMKIGHGTGKDFLEKFIEGFKEGVATVVNKVSEIFSKVTDKIHEVFIKFSESDGFETGLAYVTNFFKGVKDNVSDKASEAISAIAEAFGKLKDKIPTVGLIAGAAGALTTLLLVIQGVKAGAFANIITAFKNLNKVIKIINFVKKKDQILDFINSIKDSGAESMKDVLAGFTEGLKTYGEGVLIKVGEFFTNVLDKIKDVFGIHSPAARIIEIVENILGTFADTFAQYKNVVISAVENVFGGVVDKIREIFEAATGIFGEGSQPVIALILGIGILTTIFGLFKAIEKIAKSISQFAKNAYAVFEPVKKIVGVLDAFKKTLKAYAFDTMAEGVLKISAGITLVLGALTGIIIAADKVQNLGNVLAIIAEVALVIGELLLLVSLIMDITRKIKENQLSLFSDDPKENILIYIGQGFKKAIKSWASAQKIKAFAKSITMVVGAFAGIVILVNKYNDEEISTSIKVLAGIAAAVFAWGVIGSLIASIVKKYSLDLNGVSNDILKFGVTILAIAGALYLTVKSVEELLAYTDDEHKNEVWAKIGLTIAILSSIMALVIAYMAISSKISSQGQQVSASPIIAFAALILVTLYAFKKILKMDFSWKEDGGKFLLLIGFYAIIGALVGLLMWLGKDSKSALKAGGTILALAVWLYAAIGAVAILGKFKPQTLIKGILAIIFLYVAVAIVMANSTNVSDNAYKNILAMVAMLVACVAAMTFIGAMNVESILKGGIPIVILLLVMANVFSNIAKINTKDGTAKMWAMVTSLIVIAGGLIWLSSRDWGSILSAGAAIGGVILAYGKVFKDINKVNLKAPNVWAFLFGSIVILTIGSMLALVARHDWSSIAAAGVSISAVMLTYGKVFKDMSNATSTTYNIKNFILGSLALLVIGAALAIATLNHDWAAILSAGVAISAVIVSYGKVFTKLDKVKIKKGVIPKFIAGTVGILMIGGTLALVATQDWKSILSAGASVSRVLKRYGDVFSSMSGVSVSWKTIGQFVVGACGIILIGGTLAAAAFFTDWSSMLSAGASISAVLKTYGDVLKQLASMDVSSNNLIDKIGAFLLGTVGVVVIGYTLHEAEAQNWANMLSTGVAISFVLKSVTALIKVIAGVDKSVDSGSFWAGFILLAGGVIAALAVGTMLKQCEAENWKNMLGTAFSIITVLLGITALAAILSLIGSGQLESIIAAGAGIVILDGLIADLVLVLDAMNKLTDMDAIKDGGEKLRQVGEAIGGFFGGIADGFLSIAGLGIEAIGASLSNFMYLAQPFFDGLDQFDDEKIKSAKALVAVVGIFVIEDFISALTNMINVLNPFKVSLGSKFAALGKAIKSFAEEVDGIDAYNVAGAALACYYLTEAFDNIGLLDFAKVNLFNIEKFGSNMVSFAQSIKGICGSDGFGGVPDPEGYLAAGKSMVAIINVAKYIKSRDFEDAADLETFGNNMAAFAKTLTPIQNIGKGLIEGNFTRIKTCATILIDIARAVPNQADNTDLWGLIFGENSISKFGAAFLSFSNKMKLIQNDGKELDEAPFKKLYWCSYWVNEIANNIPTTVESGFFKELFGNKTSNAIDDFGDNLLAFAKSMISTQNVLNGATLKQSDFQNLKTVSMEALAIAEKLAEIIKFDNDQKYIDIGKMLGSFGNNLKNFGKDIKKFGEESVKGYIGFSGAMELLERFDKIMPNLMSFDGTVISTFFESMKKNAKSGMEAFLGIFENDDAKSRVTKAISTTFSYIGQAITSKKTLMEGYGRITMNYFSGEQGISSETSFQKVVAAINGIINRAVREINMDQMRNLGIDAARGFANGLVSHEAQDRMAEIAQRFANMVYNDVRRSLDIHSPSRRMAELGELSSLGFIAGLMSMSSEIASAGNSIGDSATEGLLDALNKIGENIQNEDEFNPTITPILDLSNITEEADKIGGILNVDKPIQLASNAGLSFSGGTNGLLGQIQASIPDGSNEDVVNAIYEMRADINTMADAIRNLQVVMDTGELVGVLTDPIDQQIGYYTTLSERGVR